MMQVRKLHRIVATGIKVGRTASATTALTRSICPQVVRAFSTANATIAATSAAHATANAAAKAVSPTIETPPHRDAKGFLSKVYSSPEDALHGFVDGMKVLVGGFGMAGIPENLCRAVANMPVKDLIVISNECGTPDAGVGLWIDKIKRISLSYVGANRVMEKKFLDGEVELELTPQGTLAERIRAGGAGIPAFYTPAGFGTWVHTGGIPIRIQKKLSEGTGKNGGSEVSQPKESREFNGKGYVLEEAITGDFAFIKAYKGDTEGNLIFHAAARNFNPDMAKAAKVVVVEVEELVAAGELDPDEIHLPGIYVDRIFKGSFYEKPIEKLCLRDVKNERGDNKKNTDDNPSKIRIAKRAAYELRDGMYVNLGIGIPTQVPNFVHAGMRVTLHSENGVLGVGPYPLDGQQDPELINAGKQTISYNPGASIVPSSESFALIRGRHIELTMLGGLQVSQFGDLANWIIPGKMVKGMGGAMDLVSSGNKVVVVMIHNSADNGMKVVAECSLPLTGRNVVNKIITELAVFEVNKLTGLTLVEIAPDITLEEVCI
jgi:3-oxoacid CoA-transferase